MRRSLVRAMRAGTRPRIAGTRSICSKSRRRRGSPSSCRSATGGCSPRRSRSIGERPTSWRRTSPPRRARGSTSRPAATRTCRTSVCSASPERELVFDINDFDETLPGPWEWDVKRLAASLADRRARTTGSPTPSAREVDHGLGRRLPDGDAASSPSMRNLDVWYARLQVAARARRSSRRSLEQEEPQGGRTHRREGPHEGQHAGVRQADPRRRRGAADRQRPATDRPRRGVR